ncbi:MAG: L,D-transpeptidase [Ahrensia sp.]
MRKLIGGIAAAIIAISGMTAATPASAVQLHELLFMDKEERQALMQERRAQSGNARVSNKSPIQRKMIKFDDAPVGTIVIDTSDRRLYHVVKPGRAMAYGVGVGREGFTWTGTERITRKAEWPGWTPPKTMIARVKRETGRTLPAFMEGGPNNPLGARALYLGSSLYRIHGTNQPWTIGQAMSSGCIRMANDDVTHLYNNVKVGTRVIVRR